MVTGLPSFTVDGHQQPAAAIRPRVAIAGAGPAGLFAAEVLARGGVAVDIYERMPAPARKLLMAGRGGLNLTHSEPLDALLQRYQPTDGAIADSIRSFPPAALLAWANDLGVTTFTGSSGRVFPTAMKASPLLRALLQRLDRLGVRLHTGHRLIALHPGPVLTFATGARGTTQTTVNADAALLALGGASWPRLGTDGSWVGMLTQAGVAVTTLEAANCGLEIGWSEPLKSRRAGEPLKRIALSIAGQRFTGELIITRYGLEGGPAYAAGPLVRAALKADVPTAVAGSSECGIELTLDLRPDFGLDALATRLARPRGKQSTATFLRKAAGLDPAAIAVLREGRGVDGGGAALPGDPAALAQLIKSVRLRVTGTAGLERAISTAGGVRLDGLDARFMVNALPGVFAAGEMLDWDAPTGGYLLQGAFATAAAAARGILDYLAHNAVKAEANPLRQHRQDRP